MTFHPNMIATPVLLSCDEFLMYKEVTIKIVRKGEGGRERERERE